MNKFKYLYTIPFIASSFNLQIVKSNDHHTSETQNVEVMNNATSHNPESSKIDTESLEENLDTIFQDLPTLDVLLEKYIKSNISNPGDFPIKDLSVESLKTISLNDINQDEIPEDIKLFGKSESESIDFEQLIKNNEVEDFQIDPSNTLELNLGQLMNSIQSEKDSNETDHENTDNEQQQNSLEDLLSFDPFKEDLMPEKKATDAVSHPTEDSSSNSDPSHSNNTDNPSSSNNWLESFIKKVQEAKDDIAQEKQNKEENESNNNITPPDQLEEDYKPETPVEQEEPADTPRPESPRPESPRPETPRADTPRAETPPSENNNPEDEDKGGTEQYDPENDYQIMLQAVLKNDYKINNNILNDPIVLEAVKRINSHGLLQQMQQRAIQDANKIKQENSPESPRAETPGPELPRPETPRADTPRAETPHSENNNPEDEDKGDTQQYDPENDYQIMLQAVLKNDYKINNNILNDPIMLEAVIRINKINNNILNDPIALEAVIRINSQGLLQQMQQRAMQDANKIKQENRPKTPVEQEEPTESPRPESPRPETPRADTPVEQEKPAESPRPETPRAETPPSENNNPEDEGKGGTEQYDPENDYQIMLQAVLKNDYKINNNILNDPIVLEAVKRINSHGLLQQMQQRAMQDANKIKQENRPKTPVEQEEPAETPRAETPHSENNNPEDEGKGETRADTPTAETPSDQGEAKQDIEEFFTIAEQEFDIQLKEVSDILNNICITIAQKFKSSKQNREFSTIPNISGAVIIAITGSQKNNLVYSTNADLQTVINQLITVRNFFLQDKVRNKYDLDELYRLFLSKITNNVIENTDSNQIQVLNIDWVHKLFNTK